jgi:hypothetical protein
VGNPIPLERLKTDEPPRAMTCGTTRPRAIAWFGFTAFWGHLRHLVASAIATENIDSRQWMVPDEPKELLHRALAVLKAHDENATTLAGGMGGEVWIDFVADSGDDVSVSAAVGRLMFAEYAVADPDDDTKTLELPRGDLMIHGGDIAYPVATVREITRRVLDPWNKALEKNGDGKLRPLFGIPGNHDWYDGLDGFARFCQAPCDFEGPRDGPDSHSDIEGDRLSVIEHPVLAWAEAFRRGVAVHKPDALKLKGYVPVQRSSYFRLPLAKGIDLFGVDRQLKQVDPRQRAYFAQKGAKARLVVVPDPVRAWGELRPNGVATQKALGLDLARQPTFILSGDVHHYERSAEGKKSLHVVAGGGGAFLHGARSAPRATYEILSEFPGRNASKGLLWRLPFHSAIGRAGWLLSGALGLTVFYALWLYVTRGFMASAISATVASIVVALSTAALVGWRGRRAHRVIPFALVLGALIGAIPVGIAMGVEKMGTALTGGGSFIAVLRFGAAWALGTFSSGFAFGAMLTLIARLGLNHAQPFAALGLPGYRHFVRLRIREMVDKSIVDAFVIGAVDPLGSPTGKGKAVLVDTFRWAP